MGNSSGRGNRGGAVPAAPQRPASQQGGVSYPAPSGTYPSVSGSYPPPPQRTSFQPAPMPPQQQQQQQQLPPPHQQPHQHQPQLPPPQHTANNPANMAHVTVRCPACVTTLIAPQGAPRFRCPCGQVLQLQLQRMRCPQCMGILAPPPGLQRFRCPCGALLSPPRPAVQSSAASSQERLPEGRPTMRDQIDLSSIDDILVAQSAASPSDAAGGDGDAAGGGVGGGGGGGAAGSGGGAGGVGSDSAIAGAVGAREAQRLRMSAGGQGAQGAGWTRTLGMDNFVHWSRPPGANGEHAKAWVRSISADHQITWRTAEAGYAVEGMQCPPTFDVVAHQDVARLPFSKKLAWFRQETSRLRVPWEQAHKKITVRRRHLLEDSTQQLMKMTPANFRETFRFKFDGEPALDAGGVAREWYELLTETLFNLDFGLFTYSGTDRYSYQINQHSDIANEHHLHYFRFAGRLLGKALFDGQLVEAHLVRPMYKHIIGSPIDLEDMQFVDRDTHQSLKYIRENEGADEVGVSFSVSRTIFGETITTELKPGGKDVEVDDDNKLECVPRVVGLHCCTSNCVMWGRARRHHTRSIWICCR
jgi:hypothetical protein